MTTKIRPNHPPAIPDLIPKSLVAKKLSVSTRTIDRLSERGELKKVYIGGAVRFRIVDVERLIEQGLQ